jgi:hypothetical protein
MQLAAVSAHAVRDIMMIDGLSLFTPAVFHYSSLRSMQGFLSDAHSDRDSDRTSLAAPLPLPSLRSKDVPASLSDFWRTGTLISPTTKRLRVGAGPGVLKNKHSTHTHTLRPQGGCYYSGPGH